MLSIPVTILHGFLGSGKTTVLRSILSKSYKVDCVPSVIVNDMSELDVDGVLIKNTEAISQGSVQLETISGDSISSPEGIKKLDQALHKVTANKQPPWIIIETSGSSHPLPLVEYFKGRNDISLKGVITLVDSIWIKEDYEYGTTLLPKWQENVQNNIRGIENLLVEQLMFSNQIFLTKTDKLNSDDIQNIAQALHPLNPYASILNTSWGNIDVAHFTNLENYNFLLVDQLTEELRHEVNAPLSLAGKHNQKIVAKVIKDDRPFHPLRLWQTCHNLLTRGVFRSKGFFWLPTRDDVSLLWSQSNGSVGLEFVGFWRAPILHDKSQNLSPEHFKVLQQKIDNIDSRFGDRRCRLTVIGQTDEASVFTEALKSCFLTDEELEHWQNGGSFEDPWPQIIAEL